MRICKTVLTALCGLIIIYEMKVFLIDKHAWPVPSLIGIAVSIFALAFWRAFDKHSELVAVLLYTSITISILLLLYYLNALYIVEKASDKISELEPDAKKYRAIFDEEAKKAVTAKMDSISTLVKSSDSDNLTTTTTTTTIRPTNLK
ncbi:hypothetical protein AYI71_05690 [Limosilactobacillus oris]|nr:hypothetical protein AYI71_05690 [Limosilactobacillus oris]